LGERGTIKRRGNKEEDKEKEISSNQKYNKIRTATTSVY
jgi:hypothetical protein